MAYTQGKTGIVKSRYNVYVRRTAAYTAPVTIAEVEALRTNFTSGFSTQLGTLRDKTVKMKLVAGEKAELNDGSKKTLEWVGTLELEDVNVTDNNIAYLATFLGGRDCDLLLDDPVNAKLIVVKDSPLEIEENANSGELSSLLIKTEKLVSSKAAFRERTDYSAFS